MDSTRQMVGSISLPFGVNTYGFSNVKDEERIKGRVKGEQGKMTKSKKEERDFKKEEHLGLLITSQIRLR